MTKESGLKKFANWIVGEKRQHRMLIDSFRDSNTIRPGVCCSPLPGDKIIGFRTNGDRGMSIHRESCENAFVFAGDTEKLIHCTWAKSGDFGIFLQELTILGLDKENIFPDILQAFRNRNIKSESFDFRMGSGVVKLLMLVRVKTVDELNRLMEDLKRIRGISSVHRNLPLKKIY
jgi:GTP pyrophosphokinase